MNLSWTEENEVAYQPHCSAAGLTSSVTSFATENVAPSSVEDARRTWRTLRT